MTTTQINTFEDVMTYLSKLQISFDDIGYARIGEVAEDYANDFNSFSEILLKIYFGNKLVGICNL